MRQTSLDAYNEIKNNGLLSKRRWQVYDCLFHHGPLTGNEIVKKISLPGAWKRLSELEKETVAQVVGQRICTVTGYEVELWDVTTNLPIGATHSTAIGPSRPKAADLNTVVNLLREKWIESKKLGKPLAEDHPYVTVGKWLKYQALKSKN